MRFVIRLILSTLIVVAGLLIAGHSIVLESLRSTVPGATGQPVLSSEFQTTELAVVRSTVAKNTDPPPVPVSHGNHGPAATPARTEPAVPAVLDGIDWRRPAISKIRELESRIPFAMKPEHALAALVLVLFSIAMLFPNCFHGTLATTAFAAVLACGFFVALNDILAPARMERLADERSRRFTLREDVQRSTGLVLLPASAEAAEESTAFKKAADNYLASHKEAKDAIDLLEPGRPAHMRLFDLMSRSDAEAITVLERRLELQCRLLPRPGNTWLGFADPDHLRSGLTGAALSTPESVRSRLAAFTETDDKASKNATALKLLGAMQSAEIERIQSDLVIVIVRRANGPFQFAIAFLFAFGILIFARRVIETLNQRRGMKRVLPRIPHVDPVTGRRNRTGGVITPVMVEIEAGRLEARRHRVGSKCDLAVEMLKATMAAWMSERKTAAAANGLHQETAAARERCAARRATLGFITWSIPSVGITATAFGIGNALLQAGKLLDNTGDSSESLQKFFSELSVTFDVTLFALLGSILLMWVLQRLERLENNTMEHIARAIRTMVVERIVANESAPVEESPPPPPSPPEPVPFTPARRRITVRRRIRRLQSSAGLIWNGKRFRTGRAAAGRWIVQLPARCERLVFRTHAVTSRLLERGLAFASTMRSRMNEERRGLSTALLAFRVSLTAGGGRPGTRENGDQSESAFEPQSAYADQLSEYLRARARVNRTMSAA